ncbi:MAG: mandelate racemase/muconate lactonizing enzyme family protein [Devosia sp.]|uniref:mandelate racemase/muconate lactonizing enzyme family protein n=1 Tax=Devosia sp. TaxID=1871048 RepID=UPI001ACE6966|nr:mandelate racemase/muconate lactonizing enzyme family protein [Devosia sp.]MBN9308882.1 mandelate racemase/muconate lactonizing enzyme family protein [Devosia sp.]MBN9315268.1 mandelate racemase/muconate lactonizing enzyme family protein [Devosia sp.]
MKIERIDTYVAHNWMFVEVTTDTGLKGVGESTFFGFPEATALVAKSFGDRLIGEDPLRIEYHYLSLYRAFSMRGMAIGGALSAIDQALWDIKGKHYQAPVWDLLGGRVRDKVRAMLVIPYGTPEEVAASCKKAADEGYTALKVMVYQPEHHLMAFGAKVKDMVERMALIRETVGWDVEVGIELHRNMALGESIAAIREFEQFRPLFVEDPIPPDSVLSFGEVAQKSRVPMAAGERNTTIWEFREYVEHGGVHHIRPDVGIAGGITGTRKICALAEAHHQGIIPHAVPSGPVATAAQVQLGFAVPNWEVTEHQVQDRAPWTKAVKAIVPVINGHWLPNETPGLGVELDHEGLKSIPVIAKVGETSLKTDGSVAFR